jgi:hypothetical protein
MRRVVPTILLLTVLLVGGGLVATVAYQAGLSASVTTVAAPSGTVVVPAYGYGYGWHFFGPGFGFLGLLGTILFLFIVFGLVRAVVFGFGRGPRHGHGWGPGMRDAYRARWETGAHETFEDWHRHAHDETAKPVDGRPTTPPDQAG